MLNFELFVQQADLVVSTNELRSEDVPLVDDRVVLLPLREGLRGAFPSKRSERPRNPSFLETTRVDGV